MTTATDSLVQKDRITDVIMRLFVRTDERDWAGVRACLTNKVLLDMTSMVGGEPATVSADDIVAGWEQGLQPLAAIHHQIGNLMIEVNGAEADAFCYGIASHFLPTATGGPTRVFVGSYDLHLKEIGGEWRIDLFRFKLKYIEGNRDLEGTGGEKK